MTRPGLRPRRADLLLLRALGHRNAAPCGKWDPYLAEHQWGTVREDYSESGDAWNYFTHDQARSHGRGLRSVFGGTRKFQEDPHRRDLILFYEDVHGDNGAGLGTSHQTGWTGIIARSMHLFATTTLQQVLELGKEAAVAEVASPRRA